jgi:hypothetical protein
MTFLHEAVHGATMAQINAYIKDPSSVSPQAREAIKGMNDIMLKAYKYYAILNVAGKTDPLQDALYNLGAFSDLKEFVAYGLTQPEMQQFLSAIPGSSLRQINLKNKIRLSTKYTEVKVLQRWLLA